MDSDTPDSADLDDGALVRRVLDGDVRSFEPLMRRHNARLYRIARSILGSEADAEDAMQDTYIQVFTQIRSLDDHAAFGAWAARIATRLAVARAKRRQRTNDSVVDESILHTEEITARVSSNPESSATRAELRATLERAIDTLPAVFRAVVVMRMIEEMSVAETALALAIPEDTVKTRLFRAREVLRVALGDEVDDALRELFPFGGVRCNRVVARVVARLATAAAG